MIEKRELRYGNLVKCGDRVIEVQEIGDDGINIVWAHEMSHWDYDYQQLEPIPLDKDWLERLGFIKKDAPVFDNIKMKYWVHEAVCLFFNDSQVHEKSYLIGYGFTTFNGTYMAATLRWIDNIHTLQNAFYSLTGKELTLKEPIQ